MVWQFLSAFRLLTSIHFPLPLRLILLFARTASTTNIALFLRSVVCVSVCLTVCVCVCVLVTRVSPAKTAEPLDMEQEHSRMDPTNHVDGYMLTPPGEYDLTIRARRRCGLSLSLL